MSEPLYRWNPDTAIEDVWQTVQVEPLRQDLIRDKVLVPVKPVGTIEVYRINGKVNVELDPATDGTYPADGDYYLIPKGADDE